MRGRRRREEKGGREGETKKRGVQMMTEFVVWIECVRARDPSFVPKHTRY